MPTSDRDFDDVVRAELPRLLRYATALAGDPHLAADIVQDVLVRAHSRWSRIAGLDRPDLYLKRMVTNEYLSWRRRWHVRHIRASPTEVIEGHADVVRDPAVSVADRDDVRQRLTGLPPRQRAVLVLRFFDGLDDSEIAEHMGISQSTVRSSAARALAALRPQSPEAPPRCGAEPSTPRHTSSDGGHRRTRLATPLGSTGEDR